MSRLPASQSFHATQGGELLNYIDNNRNMKAFIFYALSVVSLAIALVIFIRSLDWKAIPFLIFVLGAVLLFRQGMIESKKK